MMKLVPLQFQSLIGFSFFVLSMQVGVSQQTINVQTPSVRFHERVLLSVERPGIISKVLVKEGDSVDPNQVLATLEDSVPKAALAIAEFEEASDAEILLSWKKFESADLEYQAVRSANLRKEKTYAETEEKRLKLVAETAKLEVEVQKQRKKLAELRRKQSAAELATYELRAPFRGVITKVQKSPGASNNQQEPLLELVNVGQVSVDGHVEIDSLDRIRVGDIAEVTLTQNNGGTKTVRGKLRFIDLSIQRIRNVVRIIADFDNNQGMLRDGATVKMVIYPSRPTDQVAGDNKT